MYDSKMEMYHSVLNISQFELKCYKVIKLPLISTPWWTISFERKKVKSSLYLADNLILWFIAAAEYTRVRVDVADENKIIVFPSDNTS